MKTVRIYMAFLSIGRQIQILPEDLIFNVFVFVCIHTCSCTSGPPWHWYIITSTLRMREDRYHTKLYRIRIIMNAPSFYFRKESYCQLIHTHRILINSSWQVTLGGKGRGEGAKFMPG